MAAPNYNPEAGGHFEGSQHAYEADFFALKKENQLVKNMVANLEGKLGQLSTVGIPAQIQASLPPQSTTVLPATSTGPYKASSNAGDVAGGYLDDKIAVTAPLTIADVNGARTISAPSAAPAGLGNATATGTTTAIALADHVHKRDVRVKKASSDFGTRNALNFIDGPDVTHTIADNSGSDQVDVTGALTTTGVTAGTYGDTTHYPVVTVDNKGRLTTVTTQLAATGSGTVTSVGVTAPAEITVTGSPVTTSGTINLAWAAKAANLVFAGPSSGAAATPAFRALVAADIPNLPASQITTGLLALARGGANADLSATGGANQVVQQTSAGGALTVGTLDAASIASGTMATARLGSGSANAGTVLYGDQTYKSAPTGTVPGGTNKQTYYFNGTTLTATSNLQNDGTNVGIGPTAPDRPLLIDSTNNPLASGQASLKVVGGGGKERIEIMSAANAPFFQGVRSQGTVASPIATTSNVGLCGFAGGGYDGSTWSPIPGRIAIVSSAAWTSSPISHGVYMSFTTTAAGDTSATATERMRILDTGSVGIGTTSPNTLLDVAGGIASQVTSTGAPGGVTATGLHSIILVTLGSPGSAITMPPATNRGQRITVIVDSGTGTSIITCAGSDHFRSTSGGTQASITLNTINNSREWVADGTSAWRLVSSQ